MGGEWFTHTKRALLEQNRLDNKRSMTIVYYSLRKRKNAIFGIWNTKSIK